MKTSVLFLAISILLVGCASPLMATSNKIGKAEGEACVRNILFIIPLSLDNSIYTAATNGGLKEISTVDESSFYTGIYNQRCTVVHGSK